MSRVTVIGDGAWGTAIALHLHRTGHAVRVWGPFEDGLAAIRADGENRRFLPGIPLPPGLAWSADPAVAADGAEAAVLVVPSRFYADVVRRFESCLPVDCRIVSLTKGLDPATGRRMSEVAVEHLAPRSVAALSGPSFAEEVAHGLPTAVVAASQDARAATAAQRLFSAETFRVYTSDDMVGVELGGVLKNVIAIAAGASDALGFGTNARAALITRGLAEITRLGTVLGAHPETFAGLSGLGDLVLTCTGPLSRNRRVGERIGGGERMDDILANMTHVAEGVANCATARAVAQRLGVETPVIDLVYRVLHEGMPPRAAVAALMNREPRSEREGGRERPESRRRGGEEDDR